jgi:hypothetical protein
MSYPPQQPGPYGQQQPGQFGQSSYQGLGSYAGGSGQPPKKKNTGMIVAIVAIAVMLLGGGGVAVYFLTKDNGDGGDNAADKTTSSSAGKATDDASKSEDNSGDSTNSPDDVRDAYMAAYENKDFADVVDDSCAAYKKKFGTDTSQLESDLEPYEITASASGEPDVNGNTATAKIDLELTADGTTEKPKILIKIVEEDGQWRFCGEGKA